MTLSINDTINVSKLISDIHVDVLGRNLGFNDQQLLEYKTMNGTSTDKEGTFQMLKTWLDKDGSAEKFINALIRSGLENLAEKIQTGDQRENQGPSGAFNTQQPDQHQPLRSMEPAQSQPGNDGSIDDETLRKLARRLFTGVDDLASAIGVKYAELKRYKANNYRTGEVTADGTIQMLFDWREKVAPPEQRAKLGQALQKAQLIRVKDEFHL